MVLAKNLKIKYKKGFIYVFLVNKIFLVQKCFDFVNMKRGFFFKYFWFFFVFKILFFFGLLNPQAGFFVKFLKSYKK